MGVIGFIFGMMSFILAMNTMNQVTALKKEVEMLKSQIDPKS